MKVLRVHDTEAALEKMRRSADQLPTNAWVQITLDDGHSCRGMVRSKPAFLTGEDTRGKTGEYAVLTLQDEAGTPIVHVYLDRVVRVEQLAGGIVQQPRD